jgi:hypothetical protein
MRERAAEGGAQERTELDNSIGLMRSRTSAPLL